MAEMPEPSQDAAKNAILRAFGINLLTAEQTECELAAALVAAFHRTALENANAPESLERTDAVLSALIEAVADYGAAQVAYRSPNAKEGAAQNLWAAESNLDQALHEAKQFRARAAELRGANDG